jgi:hypothetical protein
MRSGELSGRPLWVLVPALGMIVVACSGTSDGTQCAAGTTLDQGVCFPDDAAAPQPDGGTHPIEGGALEDGDAAHVDAGHDGAGQTDGPAQTDGPGLEDVDAAGDAGDAVAESGPEAGDAAPGDTGAGEASTCSASLGQPCGSCAGTVQCDGSCGVATPATFGQMCGSCGGTVQCDSSCSVATPATFGQMCGSCGGTVQCDSSCSVATPATFGQMCGSCGGTVQCDSSCSVATPATLGQTCGSCGGTVQCDSSCSTATCPPTFAGVTSVSMITTTSVELAWTTPATDNPASTIVYVVYQGTTPGGEAFGAPVATSTAGAVNVTVTGLTSNTTYDWVVRAKNAAGQIDANTVEVTATTLVSFATDVVGAIIDVNCNTCHKVTSPDNGLALTLVSVATVYGELVGVPSMEDPAVNRITAGNAAASYLYQAVSGTQTVGSPMPLTGTLPLSEQTTIHDWIQQGALDN